MNDYFMRPPGPLTEGLKDLIKALPGGSMVEVGSFAGESTACFAEKFEIVHAVDIWDPDLKNWIQCYTPQRYKGTINVEHIFDDVVKIYPNIHKIKGASLDVCKTFLNESVDFVYIDAVHTYDAVKRDIEEWIYKIKPTGHIGGHDFNPDDFPGVIRAVREKLGTEIRVFADTSWLVAINEIC